jgi:hypothetical protein
MDKPLEDRVARVDRVANSDVLIEFADGKTAKYAGRLLRRMLPEAEPIPDGNNDDDQ